MDEVIRQLCETIASDVPSPLRYVKPTARVLHPKFAALIAGTSSRWWARWDLNPRPKDYESSALTTELQARLESFEQKGVYLGASNFFAEDFTPQGIPCGNG